MATASHPDEQLFVSLATEAEWHVPCDFDTLEFANVAQAFAEAGQFDMQQSTVLSMVADPRTSDFSSNWLAAQHGCLPQ